MRSCGAPYVIALRFATAPRAPRPRECDAGHIVPRLLADADDESVETGSGPTG
jgi:hypothetical protein